MGQISVDISALEPLPDADVVRDAGDGYFGPVEAVQTAIDQAISDWAPVSTLLTSRSMDLQEFHTAFTPLSRPARVNWMRRSPPSPRKRRRPTRR